VKAHRESYHKSNKIKHDLNFKLLVDPSSRHTTPMSRLNNLRLIFFYIKNKKEGKKERKKEGRKDKEKFVKPHDRAYLRPQ